MKENIIDSIADACFTVDESEMKFDGLADNLPVFLWTAGKDFTGNFFNKTWVTYTGLSRDELVKNGWLFLVHADDFGRIYNLSEMIAAEQKEMSFDCRLKREDGKYRNIRFRTKPLNNKSGELTGFMGYGIDITEMTETKSRTDRRNEEMQQTLKTDWLANIVNKLPNAIVLTDAAGCIVWANETFTKVTEYTLEEAIGRNAGDLLHGKDTNPQTIKMIDDAFQKKEALRVEILNYSKTGRKFWIDLRVEPVYQDKELTGYLVFKNDITQRKSDEIAIRERNDKISKVSFITSHELRHEFSKIMMLLNESESSDYSHEELKTLFAHLKEPARLINSIISKINDNLRHDIPYNVPPVLPSVEEICLIEDDKLTNMINTRLIKKITPSIPVKVYENIDSALEIIKVQPSIRRLILLDLNLSTKSGWEFLDACGDLNMSSHVLMLTSSIDPKDIEKSKKYKIVEDYICKPLTLSIFQEYAKKYCSV